MQQICFSSCDAPPRPLAMLSWELWMSLLLLATVEVPQKQLIWDFTLLLPTILVVVGQQKASSSWCNGGFCINAVRVAGQRLCCLCNPCQGMGRVKGRLLCSTGVQERGQHGGRSPLHSHPCAAGCPDALLLLLRVLRQFPYPVHSRLWSFFNARCRIGSQVPVLVLVPGIFSQWVLDMHSVLPLADLCSLL